MSREATRQPGNQATRRIGLRASGCGSRRRKNRRGLTLVELMVVIVILGVLATTVTVSVRDYLITGKQSAAKQELTQLSAALELFYVEHNRYPTNDEGLATLLERTDAHPDGLLHGGDLNDPWGHPYQYVYPGLHGTFDLVCYGADGAEGGTGANADLCSWEMK
jgi:general secretion pathway protein G